MLGLGNFYGLAEQTAEQMKLHGIDATIINPLYITGQDKELLANLRKEHDIVVTMEDGILDGGFGEKIARFYGADSKMRVLNYGLQKKFYDRYDAAELARENHLTPEQIAADVIALTVRK